MAPPNLPFIPQGFQTAGPAGQQQMVEQGITLTVEHLLECRHSHTDLAFTLDISMCHERNIKQSAFRILDGLLENAGCDCGTEPLSTPIFLQKIRSATAPRQASPSFFGHHNGKSPHKYPSPHRRRTAWKSTSGASKTPNTDQPTTFPYPSSTTDRPLPLPSTSKHNSRDPKWTPKASRFFPHTDPHRNNRHPNTNLRQDNHHPLVHSRNNSRGSPDRGNTTPPRCSSHPRPETTSRNTRCGPRQPTTSSHTSTMC